MNPPTPLFIIHDDRAKDRLPPLIEQLKVQEWPFEIVPGVVHDDPRIAISQAHLACFERAIGYGWDRVWVAEDDVVFLVPDALRRMQRVAEAEGGMVLGGIYGGMSMVGQVCEGFARLCRFSATHLYTAPVSLAALIRDNKHDHIDYFLSERAQAWEPKVVWPMVAIQRPGYSVKDGKAVDHTHLLQGLPLAQ